MRPKANPALRILLGVVTIALIPYAFSAHWRAYLSLLLYLTLRPFTLVSKRLGMPLWLSLALGAVALLLVWQVVRRYPSGAGAPAPSARDKRL